jgi:hypothetical protein
MAAPSTVFIKDWRKYNKKAVPNETAGCVFINYLNHCKNKKSA